MASIAHWRRHVNQNLLIDPCLSEVLAPAAIEGHCRNAGHCWRESFWSPAVTLVTFLLQVLSAEKTLRSAVAALLAQQAARGRQDGPSGDPAAYCQARRRFPEKALWAITRNVADRVRGLVRGDDTWLGRRVWVLDGSTASMPDTPELQEAFPQPISQTPGCGFPIARFVVLFCWATGAVIDLTISSLSSSELTLFRRMWHHFKTGDIVLADRFYSSYVDVTRLLQRGVFCVVRMHQRRKADFRTGRKLGKQDRLVVWSRPSGWLPSVGISRREFRHLPRTLPVRLIRVIREQRGCRSREIIVATTLTDPQTFPADEIRALYRDRWMAELNLRSLKTYLRMEVLRGQSPDVVRKEIAMHILAYNLIRLLMWKAAHEHGKVLHHLSFTGTLHRLRIAMPLLMLLSHLPWGQRIIGHLLKSIAYDTVPHRPDRVEPRRVKRRPKAYDLLNRPRHEFRGRVDDYAR